MRKRQFHNSSDIEGDVSGRQEGFDAPRGVGAGSEAAGQSGDVQGLSEIADADSESVEQLVEEGQAFEAEVISGVEDAPDADQGPVRTKEVSQDDVPGEYDNPDR